MDVQERRQALREYLLSRGEARDTQVAALGKLEGLLSSTCQAEAKEVIADVLVDLILVDGDGRADHGTPVAPPLPSQPPATEASQEPHLRGNILAAILSRLQELGEDASQLAIHVAQYSGEKKSVISLLQAPEGWLISPAQQKAVAAFLHLEERPLWEQAKSVPLAGRQ